MSCYAAFSIHLLGQLTPAGHHLSIFVVEGDYVSLYAGAEMEGSERLAQIGGTPAVAAFGAREGTLLITFTSDGSNQRAGFTAEYWCTSPDVLGCADPSATVMRSRWSVYLTSSMMPRLSASKRTTNLESVTP